MEVLIGIAAAAIFGFVGYQLYKSRSSQPSTSGGGRTQSTNPSRDVEVKTESKVGSKPQPKRKTSSSRSSKSRKSTPRKTSGGNKGGGSKKSTPRKSGGSGKRTNNKNVNRSK